MAIGKMADIESLYQRYAPDVRRSALFLSGGSAVAFSAGLAKSNSAMPIRAMKNFGVRISHYCSASAARQ